MDYTFFIKKKFLNQPVNTFAQSFDKLDYRGFEKIVTRNTVLGMGAVAVKVCRKDVKSVFNSVDGLPLRDGTSPIPIVRKDGFVDRDEFYQLVKDSYQNVHNKELSEEELSKMTVKDVIDLVIQSNKKKNQ